jgi:hypothetical protein
VYNGPLAINFRLPAEWSIRDERPGAAVAPEQVIVDDVGGRVQQIGAPLDIYDRPANRFVVPLTRRACRRDDSGSTLHSMSRLLVALLFALQVGCGGYYGPSAREKWPIVHERARIELSCQTLEHLALAQAQPRTTAEAYPRVYFDYAVTGCGRQATYRVLFSRGTQDEVQLVGPIRDVSLRSVPSIAAPAECVPDCRDGYACANGACVSACNPPCPEGQRCSAGADCESVGPPPPAAPVGD